MQYVWPVCDEPVDFDELQYLQDEELSHLVAVERQGDEVARLTKPCPCWTKPGFAACKRLKAQLESEANLREALASGTETIELLQAAQQTEMSILRLAREKELSLIRRKESVLQRAQSSLQKEEERVRYATVLHYLPCICNRTYRTCFCCLHRETRLEVQKVAHQKHKLDKEQQLAEQAIAALAMRLFAARTCPVSASREVSLKVVVFCKL